MKDRALSLFQQGNLVESEQICNQLLKSAPNDPQILHLLGLIYARQQAYPKAEPLLARAYEISPDTNTAISLGQIYLVMRQFPKAIERFRQVLDFDAQNTTAHFGLANTYAFSGDHENAALHYRKLIDLNAANADVFANLSFMLELSRQHEEARQIAEKAITMNPDHPVAHLVIARLDRRQKNYQAVIDRLKRVIPSNMHTEKAAELYTELGHAYDRIGEYKNAFEAFNQANHSNLQQLPKLDLIKNYYLFRINRLSSIYLKPITCDAKHDKETAPTLVFFVGFPRSGTTLVEQILNANENIVTTGEQPLVSMLIDGLKTSGKYSAEYPDNIEQISDDDIPELRAEYIRYLVETTNCDNMSKTFVDKLPLNIVEIGFIHRVFPEAKILVALRDPRDVCLSCFMQSFSLNAAMAHFLTLRDTATLYAKTMDLWRLYKQNLTDLKYLEYRYEDLVKDTVTVGRSIIEFIGHEWTQEMEQFHRKAGTTPIGTPSFIDVSTPIYNRAVGRWQHYRNELQPVREILLPHINALGYTE